MARFPGQDRRWVQLNNSDLFGNIYQSRNVNLDEEGYVKLSPRTFSLFSNDGSPFDSNFADDSFDIPAAFGREQSGEFFVATIDDPFEIQLDDDSGISGSEDDDTGNDNPPNLTIDSHGKWFQNKWHATEDQLLTYKDPSNGDWTDTAVSLTSGKLHPIEVFRNRDNLCVGDGNQVLQVTDAYASDTDLVLPDDFEVTKLAYSNRQMGVATKLSDDAAAQNGEAFFFVWDGTTASASQGVSAGTDWIYDVVAYKGSFVILTRTGLLRFWNGGGWTDLAQLPVYFTPRTWGDSVNTEIYGDAMVVDGDVIYIQVNNATERYGRKGEEYISPGGVMCYDPKAGLYHRWSPSISPVSRLTVTASNVNTSTDVLTKTAGTVPSTGSPIKYIDTPDDQIGGLSIGKVYYCIKTGSTTFKLADTRVKALNGINIDITAQSGSTSYFLAAELRDYGQSFLLRTGAVALHDAPDLVRNQIVLGAELQDHDSTGNIEHLCFDCADFPNIGYIVTPKLVSQNIVDDRQNLYIRHRRLMDGEYIKVKVQTRDIVGLPVSTPQHGQHCTWQGTSSFSVVGDLTEAETYLNNGGELECEITAGAGGGQMSQVESITCENGTCSVVLKDEIEGVSSQDVCDVVIENWEEKKTITDTDVEVSKVHVGEASGWMKVKVIMYGTQVAIYEIPTAESVRQYAA